MKYEYDYLYLFTSLISPVWLLLLQRVRCGSGTEEKNGG